MDLLDIGGGFPGSDDAELQFEEVTLLFMLVSLNTNRSLQPLHHACLMLNSFSFLTFQITTVINLALDKYFPVDAGVRIIAEPGRFYVASAYTLVVNIIAKKVIIDDDSASDGNRLRQMQLTRGRDIVTEHSAQHFKVPTSCLSVLRRGRRRDH